MKVAILVTLNREGILDYTGGPNVITRVFKSRQELRARAEDVMMEAGVMPLLKGSHAFKGRQPLEAGKGKAWVFP